MAQDASVESAVGAHGVMATQWMRGDCVLSDPGNKHE